MHLRVALREAFFAEPGAEMIGAFTILLRLSISPFRLR
jgi:hypothetical protein